MKVESFNYMPVVRINAPEWYLREDFVAWLDGGRDFRPATWKVHGAPTDEGSDVFVTYCDGDGVRLTCQQRVDEGAAADPGRHLESDHGRDEGQRHGEGRLPDLDQQSSGVMFYTDVPAHQWVMIGSQADRTSDIHSDFDVVLVGPSRADLEHPFFSGFLEKIRPYGTEQGGVLDLFLDIPSEHRLESVWRDTHGEYRAIAGGEDLRHAILSAGVEMHPNHFVRALQYFTRRGREPITDRGQFVARQISKSDKWRRLTKA